MPPPTNKFVPERAEAETVPPIFGSNPATTIPLFVVNAAKKLRVVLPFTEFAPEKDPPAYSVAPSEDRAKAKTVPLTLGSNLRQPYHYSW